MRFRRWRCPCSVCPKCGYVAHRGDRLHPEDGLSLRERIARALAMEPHPARKNPRSPTAEEREIGRRGIAQAREQIRRARRSVPPPRAAGSGSPRATTRS